MNHGWNSGTVGKVEDFIFDLLPNGKYLMEITGLQEKFYDKNGTSYRLLVLEWTVQDDGPFYGKKHLQNFFIEHENQTARHMALNSFDRLWQEIGELKENEEREERHLLYKQAYIVIEQEISKKDNKTYAKVVQHTLVKNSAGPFNNCSF